MARLATCACGQLRVTCQGEPTTVALCHCLECQKRTGSTYGVAAFFPRADVEPQGEAREYSRIGGSGSAVVFHFCPNCGSSVYWEPGRAGPDRRCGRRLRGPRFSRTVAIGLHAAPPRLGRRQIDHRRSDLRRAGNISTQFAIC
ncbi:MULTISPECIES: GFA family protein [Bradyrhizobium]|uniref:GFA family protein n=2 Tax=Bradyrhizobium TaxID=374 RepID=UPI0027D9701B|nr:GFA family protein [Bradyrhizobium brasilense]